MFDLGSLNGNLGIKLNGTDVGDGAGFSIQSAGDVNGDGLADIIIGAPYANPNGNDSGAAYVVFGKTGGLSATVELSALSGSDGFVIRGAAAGNRFGHSVGGAGDVNNDGFGDVIVGAIAATPNGALSGAAYVVFGAASSGPFVEVSGLVGTNGFSMIGAAAGDQAGDSVSGLGDVNGDGFDDVGIGASGNDIYNSNAGAAYVVFGNSTFGATISLASLSGPDGAMIVGANANDFLGGSVSSAGDVNKDGMPDIIVGATGSDIGGVDSGAAYVILGSPTFPSLIDVSSLSGGLTIAGAAAGSLAGYSVSAAGDINGDSYGDVIIGAPFGFSSGNAGASYVVLGSQALGGTVQLNNLNGFNGFKIQSQSGTEHFGTRVSAAGDVNFDGTADLIAGANGADTSNGAASGAAYVIFGKPTPFAATLNLSALDSSNGFQIVGASANDGVGQSVSAAGDLNADGVTDFLVGAPGAAPNGASSGSAYVIFGQPMTDIDVKLVAGALLLADTNGAHSAANLTFVRNGLNLEIFDASAILKAGPRVTQIDPNRVSVLFSDITSTILISGGDRDDYVLLDYSNGDVSSGQVSFSGGVGRDDIQITGGNPTRADAVMDSTPQTGNVTFDSQTLSFNEVEGIADQRDIPVRTFTGAALSTFGFPFEISENNQALTNFFTGTGSVFVFNAPADSLAIFGGDGNDSLLVSSFQANPTSVFLFDGGVGSDQVTLASALAVDSLDLIAENIQPLPTLTLGSGGAQLNGPTISFGNSATLRLSIFGSAASVSSGAVEVAGTIDIANVNLVLNVTVSGAVNGDVSLIINDGSDPVIGRFNGLQEGAGFSLGGTAYAITYVGGDGNDVVLRRVLSYGRSLLDGLDGTNGFSIPGTGGTTRLGSSASSIGDVNGDGFDDFAIGAPRASGLGGSEYQSGASYVIFGRNTGFPASLDLTALDGTDGFVISGTDGYDNSGSSLSGGGDINGDGFDDILVGAFYANPDGPATGAAYVIFGKSGSFSPSFALSSLDGTNGFRIDGAAIYDRLGSATNAVGDVNGDGLSDVVLGAPSAGRAYVIFGSRTAFPARTSVSSLNGTNGFTLVGEATPQSAFGASVATVDINGDGFADVVVGDPGFSPTADTYDFRKGAVYVIFGKGTQSSPTTTPSALNGKNGFKIVGKQVSDGLGTSVSSAGDVTGDGFDDLIIGAPGNTFGQPAISAGSAVVIFGKAKGWTATFDLLTLAGTNGFEIAGTQIGDLTGGSVSNVGDFNGDDIDDFIVGSAGSTENGPDAGAAHIIFGRSTGFPPRLDIGTLNGTTGYTFLGGSGAGAVGISVSSAGDINDDGLADAFIGSPNLNVGVRLSGSVLHGGNDAEGYVIFGKAPVYALPVIKSGGASITFTDVDGDLITVKVTKGKVNADMFTFSAQGDILLVDLSAGGTLKPGTNITFSVKPLGGNGTLDVGAIIGHGMHLGKITITGDLGQIDITPLDPLKPVIKQLSVGSLGMMGGSNQIPGTVDPLVSDIEGALGKLIVKRDIHLATLHIQGALGSIAVGGNFDGTGAFSNAQIDGLAALGHGKVGQVSIGTTLTSSGLTAGSIGKLTIKQNLANASVNSGGGIKSASVGGSVDKSAIVARGQIKVVKVFGAITSDDPATPSVIVALATPPTSKPSSAIAINTLTVRGDVKNAEILLGYDSLFRPVNGDASVGKVTIKGSFIASSLVAGVMDDPTTPNGFGRGDKAIGAETDTTPNIVSRIASLVIQGTIQGTVGTEDSFGITAQKISKAKINKVTVVLDKLALDDVGFGDNGDVRLIEVL